MKYQYINLCNTIFFPLAGSPERPVSQLWEHYRMIMKILAYASNVPRVKFSNYPTGTS